MKKLLIIILSIIDLSTTAFAIEDKTNFGGCKYLTQVRGGITFSNIIRLSSTK